MQRRGEQSGAESAGEDRGRRKGKELTGGSGKPVTSVCVGKRKRGAGLGRRRRTRARHWAGFAAGAGREGENGLRWSQAEAGAGASWAGHGRELGRGEKRERRAGLRERAGPGILLGWVLCFFPIFFLLFYSNSNHSN